MSQRTPTTIIDPELKSGRVVYLTVPDSPLENPRPVNWARFKEMILKTLSVQIGKSQAMTSGEIAYHVGIPDEGTNVRIREAITELIEKDNKDIVAGGKGFYIPETPADANEYLESLCSRQTGLGHRIEAVKRMKERLTAKENKSVYLFPGMDKESKPKRNRAF